MAVNGRTAQTVLAVHSAAGLYATDRMFLESVLGLRESGGRVVVVLPSTGPLVTELVRAGVEVEILEMLVVGDHLLRLREWPRTVLRSLRGLLRSWRLISRVRPDVAYVSTATIPQWPLLARCRGVRSVSHLHEVASSGNSRLDRLLHLPHLTSQRMLVSDRFSLEALRRVLPVLARRADIVHDGVASPRHPAPPREPLESPVRLLYMGPLSPRRSPDLALEAAALLRQEGRPVEFTVLGSTEKGAERFERQLRVQAAASGVDVDFAGFHRDIWPFLAGADILLAPSRLEEPFGNSAIEAVLALRPVVAGAPTAGRTPEGGYRTVRLVPPGDARATADALEEIIRSWSHIVRLLGASREAALRRHDPATYRARVNRACGVGSSDAPSPRT